MKMRQNKTGFTLVEMMLVLVIVSILIVMGINYTQQQVLTSKIDKTVADMQQILNGALAYYVANGTWPCATATASSPNSCPINYPTTFMPTGTLTTNPWGTALTSPVASGYIISDSVSTFYVMVQLPTNMSNLSAVAQIIAGKLPVSYLASDFGPMPPTQISGCTTGKPCYVVSSVNIPAQNLNNAGNVTYAGLYHSGACVPQPSCPVDQQGNTMTPQIMVVPDSVSGVYDAPTGSNCSSTNLSGCTANVYPISSFTAYATQPSTTTGAVGPVSCDGKQPVESCSSDSTGNVINDPVFTNLYWRVCLGVVTEKGTITPANNQQGQLQGTIMAITRCAPKNEKTGSGFTVWSQ